MKTIQYWLNSIKWFIQRGRRGWADCDLWSLDDYWARVMSGSLKQLRDTNHGYPSIMPDGESFTMKGWSPGQDKLWVEIQNVIILGLEGAIDPWNYGGIKREKQRKENLAVSLELLKHYWFSLWD